MFRRLLKIDKSSSKPISALGEETNLDLKRKNLINLREKLIPHKNIMNERIPQKLIIELASLPIHKFKVEAKSKCQSIILPIAPKQSHQIKSNKINGQSVKQENGCDDSELDTVNENNVETMNWGENRLPKPLENSYVSLKCTIINKNLALVPPIKICIPYNYPDSNPLVDCIQLEDFDDDMLPGYSNFYPSLFFIFKNI